MSALGKETVSSADARRNFSRLLRGAQEGRSFIVTRRGKPVARILPAGEREASVAGRQALLARLAKKPIVQIGRWSRDEIYDVDGVSRFSGPSSR